MNISFQLHAMETEEGLSYQSDIIDGKQYLIKKLGTTKLYERTGISGTWFQLGEFGTIEGAYEYARQWHISFSDSHHPFAKMRKHNDELLNYGISE